MMPIVHINQAKSKIDFYLSQCIYSYFFALEEIKCTQQWKKLITPFSIIWFSFNNKHQCAANLYQICPKHKQIDDN